MKLKSQNEHFRSPQKQPARLQVCSGRTSKQASLGSCASPSGSKWIPVIQQERTRLGTNYCLQGTGQHDRLKWMSCRMRKCCPSAGSSCYPRSVHTHSQCSHTKSDAQTVRVTKKTSSQCALSPTIFILVCINNVSPCGAQVKSDTPCAPKANAINLYTTAVSTGLPITPNKGLYTSSRLHSPLQPVPRGAKKRAHVARTNRTCIIQYLHHSEHYATNNDKSANKTSVLQQLLKAADGTYDTINLA